MTAEGGSVLFICSVYGTVGMPGQIGYCATKGALAAASRAMAIELARRRIRVNSLSPGLVLTQMTEAALAKLSPEQVDRLRPRIRSASAGPGCPRRGLFCSLRGLADQVDLPVDGGYTAQ
jgi:NAD(P)-dependent dehydrogenase (short-subunit alcohol dehydrogenase family)